jgi:hypothetical protein
MPDRSGGRIQPRMDGMNGKSAKISGPRPLPSTIFSLLHSTIRRFIVWTNEETRRNGVWLFRRPKLTLSCSAEGKEGRKEYIGIYVIHVCVFVFVFVRACVCVCVWRSRDSAVGITTGYGLDDRGVGVWVPVGSRIFSSANRPGRHWGPLNLISNGYRGLYPGWGGGKPAGAWIRPHTTS